jgi:hypothetical protein
MRQHFRSFSAECVEESADAALAAALRDPGDLPRLMIGDDGEELARPFAQDFSSMPIIRRSCRRSRRAVASAVTRVTMLASASQVMRSSAEAFVHGICAASQAACSWNGR